MEKYLINIKELAEYLGGVAVQTIYDWVHDKRIPYIKVNRCLRFPKQLIDEWLRLSTHIPLDLQKKINYNAQQVRGEEIQ